MKTPEELEMDKEEKLKMLQFYHELWSKLPVIKRCSVCNMRIWGENRTYYWDHLIEKAGSPDLKYAEWNMAFVCGDCHSLKTAGSPKEKHKMLIEEAELVDELNIFE